MDMLSSQRQRGLAYVGTSMGMGIPNRTVGMESIRREFLLLLFPERKVGPRVLPLVELLLPSMLFTGAA